MSDSLAPNTELGLHGGDRADGGLVEHPIEDRVEKIADSPGTATSRGPCDDKNRNDRGREEDECIFRCCLTGVIAVDEGV